MATAKEKTQALLKQFRLYYRIKASRIYDVYWRLFDRRVLDARRTEVTFYRNLLQELPPSGLVFDVGANHGWKTSIFLGLGARVVAVEPDQKSQEILKLSFHRYRWFRKPVTIVGKAAGEADTIATMWIDAPGSAKNTLSPKWVAALRADDTRFGAALNFAAQRSVTTTTLDRLIADYGVPFFIKIDVEGHEIHVLRGLHQRVPFLSFEVNLPEFQCEGLECVELLGSLCADGCFNYVTDCREGLVLDRWLGPADFARVLANCSDKSIEVFWTTRQPAAVRRATDAPASHRARRYGRKARSTADVVFNR
jgi:FkbM family methyltransferase